MYMPTWFLLTWEVARFLDRSHFGFLMGLCGISSAREPIVCFGSRCIPIFYGLDTP